MKYKDPKQSINVRIKDLMDRMTLAEKIGQMTQIERKVASAQVMKDYFIGKVCRDPRWGRCYESYSEDHNIVQEMTEIIPGLQGDVPANYRKGVPYISGK
ncbi:hypothetical protein BHE74_00057319 [Ensete ventricosum]|nr:hypothetical protein BHE74_00057319 [Ensete ventricosum]